MPTFFSTAANPSRFLSLLRRQQHEHKRSCTPNPLDSFAWPAETSFRALGEAIAASRGLSIVIRPIPQEMRHAEVSGLTTVIGSTAHVFYDADLSPINQEQTVLHEYAHILHGDVRADSECTHMRSMFEDPVEKRAETTGMQLLAALQRRRLDERAGASDLVDFLSGTDSTAGRR